MDSIIGDVSREFINLIYYQMKNKKTKKRINYIISSFLDEFLGKFYPFIYIFLIMIIALFIMNAIQFYVGFRNSTLVTI